MHGLKCLIHISADNTMSTREFQEPSDSFAFEHDVVTFACYDSDAIDLLPTINISGQIFYRTTLPRRYAYTADGVLSFYNVMIEDDGTSYQCTFANSTYRRMSRTALLHVYEGMRQCQVLIMQHCASAALQTLDLRS